MYWCVPLCGSKNSALQTSTLLLGQQGGFYIACADAYVYAFAYAYVYAFTYAYAYAGDVQEVENREEVEAAEAAQDNADREAFEHT